MSADQDRRVKILSVSADLVKQFFFCQLELPQWVYLCRSQLPPDARLVSVHANWASGAVEFMVRHPSFPPVPEGEVPPYLTDVPMAWERFELKERPKHPPGPVPEEDAVPF